MSMLEQAIVDAKDLREVAKANAEAEVLEKYSSQIKEAVDRLLEQDDKEEMEAGDLGAEAEAEVLDLDAAEETSEVEDDLPMSYEAQPADEKEEAEQMIDDVSDSIEQAQNVLDQLAVKVAKMGEEDGDEEMVTIDLDKLEDSEVEIEDAPGEPDAIAEEIDISEDELLGLMEKLTVDTSAQKSGWAGRPDSQVSFEQELELARMRSTELEEDNAAFKAAVEELTESKNSLEKELTEKNNVIKNTAVLVESLQNKLSESHLVNTKLFYTNKALLDDSLNERQKSKIVETINRADTTDKVKAVFETLCESVSSEPAKNAGPENLTEALKVRTLVARPSKKQTISESSDVLRMKRLAGIL
jgi:tellurite resistance protein